MLVFFPVCFILPVFHVLIVFLRGSQVDAECRLCQRAAEALEVFVSQDDGQFYDGESSNYTVGLGCAQELEHNISSCKTCESIYNNLYRVFKENIEQNKPWRSRDQPEYSIQFIKSKISCSFILETPCNDQLVTGRSNRHLITQRVLSLFPDTNKSDTDRRQTRSLIPVVDPHFIDLDKAQQWIQHCNDTHPPSCRQSLRPRAALASLQILLIDVFRMCLVQAEGTEDYLALSYVWGQSPDLFATSKANLHLLSSSRGFESPNVDKRLPGTVKRALELTRLVGQRYLWIDRFCIIQDDPIHTASQVNGMATIYSNASLTLCAADGLDSDTGLLGIPGSSSHRKVMQTVYDLVGDFGTSTFVVPSQGYKSIYDARGWTFQEKQLSRRTLSFTPRGMICQCDHSLFAEDRDATFDAGFDDILRFRRSDMTWPNYKRWYKMLAVYLRRNLTYAEDILRAFGGVEEAFRSSIGIFHYGLPEAFFDLALLWIPKAHLTRRTQYETVSSRNIYPSWSWAGWHGPRTPDIYYLGLGHLRTYEQISGIISSSDYTKDIVPQVQWFKTTVGGEKVQRICNDYATYQENHESLEILPAGWSRSWKDGKAFYTYDLAPPHCSFWYPVPTIRGKEPSPEQHWSQVLYFETYRTWLVIGDRLTAKEQHATHVDCPVHSLLTFDRKWAGVLYVHELLESNAKDMETASISCELIIISRGFAVEDDDAVSWHEWSEDDRSITSAEEAGNESAEISSMESLEAGSDSVESLSAEPAGDVDHDSVSEGSGGDGHGNPELDEEDDEEGWNRRCFPEWSRLRQEGYRDRYQFYNILWIQWQDDIAYRKGVGRVVKDIWDELEAEEVKVLLG